MDFGGDDDGHPYYGCDRACAYSVRFSWFAVPQPPGFAAARMPPLFFTEVRRKVTRRPHIDGACDHGRHHQSLTNQPRVLNKQALASSPQPAVLFAVANPLVRRAIVLVNAH
jgi:hypothetical protein